MTAARAIIVTDLDGTLLDARTYSCEAAREALDAAHELGVPVIPCSSKTRAEIAPLRDELGLDSPFIAENGGGVFVPREISLPDAPPWNGAETAGPFHRVVLGARYSDLRAALTELRAKGFPLRGFGDMSDADVAALTGLAADAAARARTREFDEPFVIAEDADVDRAGLVEAITALGLRHTEGRIHHLMGASDKGRAVDLVARLYERDAQRPLVVALGDAPNDVPMLARADRPVLVRRPEGDWHERALRELAQADPRGSIVLTRGVGPAGWNEAVLDVLRSIAHDAPPPR